MLRILILLTVVLVVFTVYWFRKAPSHLPNKRIKSSIWWIASILLVLLMLSGKLNGLLATGGVVLAFLWRSMPYILRYAPQLHGIWTRFSSDSQKANDANSKPTSKTGMTKVEALRVLGLRPGSTEEEIVLAHRKLIARVHPDRGGSDYLAAQINQAKKVLLGR